MVQFYLVGTIAMAIAVKDHWKSELQNVWYSNVFGIPISNVFGIQALTVIHKLV